MVRNRKNISNSKWRKKFCQFACIQITNMMLIDQYAQTKERRSVRPTLEIHNKYFVYCKTLIIKLWKNKSANFMLSSWQSGSPWWQATSLKKDYHFVHIITNNLPSYSERTLSIHLNINHFSMGNSINASHIFLWFST